jgi:putative thioredoxin
MSQIAKDVTDAEFATAVLARSREVAVLVDLWAPWCGPCRQLTPILEKVVASRRGDVELVKINVDENPVTAGQLGARSIPLVIGFRDGQAVSKFVGAQPEAAVRLFVDKFVPSQADRLVAAADKSREAGDTAEAEVLLGRALELDRQHKQARLDLAELMVLDGRYQEALTTLSPLASKGNDPVSRLMAEIRTKMAGSGDTAALEARVSANPDDLTAAVALGQALGAGKQYERALEVLLAALGRDPGYGDGAARQAIVDLLRVMGPENPLTREYRQKLATVIH